MSDACMLKSRWRGCCCNCRYHLCDLSHPATDGGRITKSRGWICAPPEIFSNGVPAAFSGWTKHGMCEMYSGKK